MFVHEYYMGYAYLNNVGGWAWLKITESGVVRSNSSADVCETHNRNELIAFADIISDYITNCKLSVGDTLKVHTASWYVYNAFARGYLDKWRWHDWKEEDSPYFKIHPTNTDIWISLDNIFEQLYGLDISLRLVKIGPQNCEKYNLAAKNRAQKELEHKINKIMSAKDGVKNEE